MEKLRAKSIIKSRRMINTPGKYRVKVTACTPYHKDLANDQKQVAIINVNAMTGHHVSTAKALFSQGEYQQAVNQNLSASVRESDYLPSKGEIIDIVVDHITTNNNVEGLFITSYSPVKAETNLASVNVDDWDSEETEGRVDVLSTQQGELAEEAETPFPNK